MSEYDGLRHQERRSRRPNSQKELRRSSNQVLAGVVAGIAAYIDTDPGMLRWVCVLLLVLTVGMVAVPYLLLWVLLPPPA